MTAPDLEADETVDARGAACPGPLMDLVGTIRSVDAGTVVALYSDADQSHTDVPEWAEEAGNDLLGVEERDDHSVFYVEKT